MEDIFWLTIQNFYLYTIIYSYPIFLRMPVYEGSK